MRLYSIGMVALVLFGCNPWPPHEEELTSNFHRHRAAFEELADMFAASPYPYVQPGHEFWSEDIMVSLNSDVLRQFKSIEGRSFVTSKISDDGTELFDQPVDNPELIALINTVGLPTLLGRGSEGERIFFRIRSAEPDEGIPTILYTRDSISKAKLQPCEPTFGAYDCGRCKIDLENDWYIFYGWSPTYYELLERYGDSGAVERHLQATPEHELSDDEIGAQRRRHYEDFKNFSDACYHASEPAIRNRKDTFKRSHKTLTATDS